MYVDDVIGVCFVEDVDDVIDVCFVEDVESDLRIARGICTALWPMIKRNMVFGSKSLVTQYAYRP
jgi:hypothetical protein